MTIIAQFDTDPTLINISNRHHAWHTTGGAHGFPSRQYPMGSVGSGHEFFQFHRDLMNEFFTWNNIHHAVGSTEIAAWHSIPAELKVPETGWPSPWPGLDLAAAETRINSNSPPFVNDDALGIFAEGTIHNWIHGAVAAAPAFHLSPEEQDIISHFHSVKSTWFYKIHGLVDLWWSRFLHPKNVVKDTIDTPPKAIIIDVTKPHIIDVPSKHIFDIPPKLISEAPDPFKPTIDPAVIESLTHRIAQLEGRAKVKKSPFIKPFMRPEVGHEIMNVDPKKTPE
ncbi:hypothetical protein QO004_004018 [Rhizobium mesoamericanum]|uniref:hypothetical protein n=1 Tax=Rhizobium mesoamericanum TaxID=1079800 RepID=UPI002785F5DA|nr:hypothetical protein [Rhizobium mesoamericanum]MDQ0562213.1 hypothetical protein [Rhizobium mesoamericanum]